MITGLLVALIVIELRTSYIFRNLVSLIKPTPRRYLLHVYSDGHIAWVELADSSLLLHPHPSRIIPVKQLFFLYLFETLL